MKGKPILWVVLLAVALVVAACGGAPEPTAEQPSPQVEVDESEPALAEQPTEQEAMPEEAVAPTPTVEAAPEEAVEPEAEAEQETVEEAAPAAPALEPRPHRTAPASPAIFVSDQAQFVGATSSPQLIEFFTYW